MELVDTGIGNEGISELYASVLEQLNVSSVVVVNCFGKIERVTRMISVPLDHVM